MFIRLVFIAFCVQFHCCGSVQVSKFIISRITFAIKCFQEQESKRIFILREWPVMEPIGGEAEKNLSVDAYMSPPILIFDVLTCYGEVINPLCCPVCLKSGQSSKLRPTGLWTDGTTRCVYEPRVVYDVSCSLLLVSAVYSCCNSHQIPAHNPHVLSSLPSLLYVPFYLTNRAGFTTDMLTQICSLVDSGLSFHSVEGVICSQYRQHYWRLRCRFTEACARLGVSSLSFPEFSQGTFPYPHEILLREVFMAYSSLFHHTFHTDMAVRTSSWISCDHTFKSAANIGFVRKSDGKWIKLFKCIFCVMGIDGSVIHWRFTRGESFEEVRDLFVELRSRFNSRNISCQGIVIDNCCKWKGMLTGIFHNVQVKLDLFHAVQRFQRTLSSDVRLRSGICREYGLVFRSADDLGEKRLKATPDTNTILRNLESFEKKWLTKKLNGNFIINAEGKNAIQHLKVHINRGCLSGIPAHASTSGNERLHRHLNYAIRTNRISVEMALIRCSRLFFMVNNANKDMASLLSFPLNFSASSEGCGRVDCFGVKNKNGNCSTNSSLQEGFPLREYKSLRELTSKEVSDLKEIIASSITHNSGNTSNMPPFIDGEHSYSTDDTCDSPNDTALEMAVAALNFYSIFNGLESLGCTKFLSKSKLPASIGLGTFGTKQVKLLTSSAVSLPPEHACHSESILIGHLEGFGLSRIPVAGDGNCFFTAVAFQLHQLMSTTDVPALVVNSLSSIGITTNMTIPQLASLLRELVVEEWISDHIDNYMNFVSDSVDFLAEVKQFEQSGYHHGPLGDLMPMAMANVLHMPLAIVTSEPHSPLISVCPSGSPITDLPLFLAYNSFGAGHYDGAVLVTKDVSLGGSSSKQESTGTSSMDSETKESTVLSTKNESCRCGRNVKKGTKRSYRNTSRCNCILKYKSCNQNCKCVGHCGGIVCRKKVFGPVGKTRNGPSPEKAKHLLQTSVRKSPLPYSENLTISGRSFNFLEICVLCAIIHGFKDMGVDCWDTDKVYSMYISIIEALLGLGIILPILECSKQAIERELHKLRKQFHDDS